MNPKHYQIRVKPEDGTLWLVLAKPGSPVRRIRDMTHELLWALCADISAALDEDGHIQSVERSISFNDGMSCKVNVVLTGLPDRLKKNVA